MNTPLPDDYVQYLDLLRSTGHHLEMSVLSTTLLSKGKTGLIGKEERKGPPPKSRGRRKRVLGPRGPRPVNQAPRSFQLQESQHAKAYKDIAQTLIDRRKLLNQCSRCGDPGHFWRKCTATNPVVASAHRGKKRTA
jgi:hypothetical protein